MTRRLFALTLALLIGLLPLLPATAWAEETDATITLAESAFPYNGTQYTPKVSSVRFGTTELDPGQYTVSYGQNIYPGEGTVTVTGLGTYEGKSATTSFTIEKRVLNDFAIEDYVYAKSYDGTTVASPKIVVNSGVLPGDSVSVRCDSAYFDDPYVGYGKALTLTGISLDGPSQYYYRVPDTVKIEGAGQITACYPIVSEGVTLAIGGNELDLTSLVTGVDVNELSFALPKDALGCTLEGSKLISGDTTGSIVVTVIAQDSDVGGSTDLEYWGDTTHITITLQEKEPQGGGTTGGGSTGGTTPDASQGAFVLVCDRKTLTYGETLALRTTGGSGSGAVRYTVDTRLGGGATVDQDGILTATKVGEVVVSATKDGDDRYQAAASQAVILSIQPATITIQVGDRTVQVGDAAPAAADLGYTVKGLVGRDTLAKAPTLAYVAKPNMDRAGTATVRASGAKVPDGGNYVPTITYRDGTLTIRAAVLYAITVEKPTNGTLTVDRTTAAEGDSVTVTATPGKGYELDRLTVETDKGGTVRTTQKSGDRYSFTMPARAVTVSAAFRAAEQLPFTDVRTGDWWYGNVLYVYEKGLMTGTSQTTFSPQATTTRGMIVTILHRLAGSPGAGGAPFTDVSAGQYYAVPIAWAASHGIVNGYDAARFGPNDPITREQMAAILYRYADRMGYDTTALGDPSQFRDSGRIHAYAWTPLAWANGRGLINGKGDGVLDPTGQATRAEVAAILQRFCEGFLK